VLRPHVARGPTTEADPREENACGHAGSGAADGPVPALPAAARLGASRLSAPRAARGFLRLAAGRHLPFALALLALALFFHRPLLGGWQFAFRDASRMMLPLRAFARGELQEGRFPLWFPWEAGGVPYFAQLVPGVLHPVHLLGAILPFAYGLALSHVLTYALAAWGTYLLARGRGAGRWPSAAGALVYALGGPLVTQSNLQYLLSAATLPVALAATERLLDRPDAARLVAAAAVLACVLLGGDPQAAYFAAFFALADALARRVPLRAAGLLALAGAGAALLAAVQILPAAEAFAASSRALDAAVGDDRALLPARLLEILVPDPFLRGAWPDSFTETLGLPSDVWSTSLFVAPVAVALAAAGVGRDRRSAATALVGLLLLWAAFGHAGRLEPVLRAALPLWSGFRYPEKLVAPVTLAVAVLSAQGIEQALAGRVRLLRHAGTLLIAAHAAAGVLCLAGPARLTDFLWHLWLASTPGAAAGAVLWLACRPECARWRAAALPVLVTAPLLHLADAPVLVPDAVLLREPAVVALIRGKHSGPAPARILSLSDGVPRFGASPVPAVGLAQHMHELLAPDFGALHGVETFDWYLPARDPAYRFADSLPRPDRYARLLPARAVDFLVVDSRAFEPPPPWVPAGVEPSTGIRLFRPAHRLERAFVARSAQPVADATEAVRRLVRRDFPAGDIVLAECVPAPDDGDIAHRGVARIETWEPDRVRVVAELVRPAFVVLNDAWAQGWHATADGVERPVCRIDGFARGVKLPAGRHVIDFDYRPRSFVVGTRISVAALLGSLCVVVAARLRRRRAGGASAR